MLKVDQYDYIRTAHRVYGKTIKQITRETGHSKNTIRKILRGQYKGYSPREHQPYPALGPYLSIIDRWLIKDKVGPPKQRHTAVRIYHRLQQEHDYQGSEVTVRRYVRDARDRLGGGKHNKAFIPSDPQPGREAEVDWGKCVAVLGGEPTSLKLYCMRSKGSGKHFVQCFPCERQQAFFEGHIRAFQFFGGIFPVLIYDNLTTAVQKVFRGKDRRLQEGFLKFKGYYNFTARFCNRGQGHEKGGVEGLVGYARRNYMVPVPIAADLDELNRNLLAACMTFGAHRMAGRDKTVQELHEQEKQFLLPLPGMPFSNIDTWAGRSDKFSTVAVDKNRYSVPTRYAGRKITALIYVDQVVLYHERKNIACHQRLFGNNKWQLNPLHYLELIQQRPQAFDSARPIRQWRKQWPEVLEALLERFRQKQGDTKGVKDFIRVLMLVKAHSMTDVSAAVETALTANVSSSEAVIHILESSRAEPRPHWPLENWMRLPSPDVSVYDQIGGDL